MSGELEALKEGVCPDCKKKMWFEELQDEKKIPFWYGMCECNKRWWLRVKRIVDDKILVNVDSE